MTQNKKETEKTKTKKASPNVMKASVQEARNKATAILRMVRVNEYMAKIFNTKRHLEETKTNQEAFLKNIAKKLRNLEGDVFDAQENLATLKETDPRYEDKKEVFSKILKDCEERKAQKTPEIEKEKETGIKDYNEEIKGYEDRIAELEGFIVKVENGEIKMSIDEVNALAEKLILES